MTLKKFECGDDFMFKDIHISYRLSSDSRQFVEKYC
jgi:hypothetical protein